MSAPAGRPRLAVRPATRRERRAIGDVLGRAFVDDPVWTWLTPDPARRARHFGALFAHVAHHRIRQGTALTTDGCSGAALWAAPGSWQVPPLAALPAAGAAVRAFGAGSGLVRAGRSVATMERHHPKEPHWYLEVLGTDPELQGRGVGSALLAPVLERCDGEGTPAFLESSKPENLAFYGRFGFEVTEEFRLADGAPPMWRMWRSPR